MTEFELIFRDLFNFRGKVYRYTNSINEYGQEESQEILIGDIVGVLRYIKENTKQDQPVSKITGDYKLYLDPTNKLEYGDILKSKDVIYKVVGIDDLLMNDHVEIYLENHKEQ